MTESDVKKLYSMSLHEAHQFSCSFGYLNVIRVQGGWIYVYMNNPPVFVPYSDEYKPNNPHP